MNKYKWDTQIDYLKTTRAQLWNDDYLEFLVKSVWKLDSPKHIVDFGCGYGYLGMKLLPLLPEGSTYTGIDIGVELLNEAREIFKNSPFITEFINVDLENYSPAKQYDIAICQAVLRHIPKPKAILQKMIDSVSTNGKIICIEVNRRMENAGLYIDGVDYDKAQKDSILGAQWENELESGGRDYMLGIKVPIYMEELGLKDIGVRVNDFVEFISPSENIDDYSKQMDFFLRTNGFQELKRNDSVDISAIKARSLLISYGTKY